MDNASLWWLITGLVVIAEMLTGTFYLLMLALGLAAGALAAHAGLALSAQMVVSALVGMGAVALAYVKRKGSATATARADRSVILDVGEHVQVDVWQGDGTAQVKYRGAQWTALYRGDGPPSAGMHQVCEMQGNRLVLERVDGH